MEKVIDSFNCSFQLLSIHGERRIKQQDDIAWLLSLRVRVLVEDCASLEIPVRVARGETRIAQVVARDSLGSAIGRDGKRTLRHIDAVVEREIIFQLDTARVHVRFKLVRLGLSYVKSSRWRDRSDRILVDDVKMQVELVDRLRIAERWLQRKREMRYETVDGQHLRVFHLNLFRAIRRNQDHLR